MSRLGASAMSYGLSGWSMPMLRVDLALVSQSAAGDRAVRRSTP